MKNKALLYGLIAVGGYLLWKKYFKKTEVIVDETIIEHEFSLEDEIHAECSAEAIVQFEGSKASEEVKKEWIKRCVMDKMKLLEK